MYATPKRDHLVVITSTDDLLLYEANTHTYPHLRSDESAITHFELIPPQNELIITLGKNITLSLWDTATGVLVHSVTLDIPATHLACNATYPYVTLSFSTGVLKLYGVIRKVLQPLCQFNLTKSPIDEVKYFEQNKIIAAVSKDQGEIFVIEGVPGGKFKVLAGVLHDAQIADYIVVGGRSCLKVFLIPVTSDRYLAGNKLIRYCVIRHQEPTMKTYHLENSDKLYTNLYVSRHQTNRDRVFYASPFDNKNLHELEVKRGVS